MDLIHEFWLGLQQGQLPDLGGWNYMLMAMAIMIQGRPSAVLSGVAAAAGYLNLGLIILVALLARLSVDLLWYKVGSNRRLGRVGHGLGRRVGLDEGRTIRVRAEIQIQPLRFVLLAKLVGGLSVPFLMAVGNARVPYRRWLPASFAGELIWTLPLLLFGFFATDALAGFEGNISAITLGLPVVFAFLFLLKLAASRWLDARHLSRSS